MDDPTLHPAQTATDVKESTMNRSVPILVSLLAALALTMSACADDEPDTAADADFNQADVTFAQEMIPHHQQAIEMAQLAQDRAEDPEVKDLAAQIEDAQDPEIQTMTGWLESWGEGVPSDDMDHGDMSGDDMPGMMTDEEMAGLQAAGGAEFDQMFLTMMIEHHEGAIEMARTEQADGQNADAVALAEKIEADQTAEIATIEDLLQP
jgi:uncharacterized protein (DUF305 family)